MHQRLAARLATRPWRLSHLALAAGLLAQAAAQAQTAPANPGAPGTPDIPVTRSVVVITGQAEATDRALRDQAAADHVVSVVRADGIGRLPDKNAAEALQRLPGVSVERDQGEGRYVRIRGLGPDLNSVSLNGATVPAPEAGRRAVALDVLPSSLVRALVVSKTQTPDMDANALGGHIDVQTISAFDHPGRFASADLAAGYETNTKRTSPSGAVVWSNLFDEGRFGLALGLSHEQRKFGSDNTETGGAWDGDALEEFERRDYRITRDRTGLTLNAEYRPANGHRYHARVLASRFSDDERRQAHSIEFADAQTEGQLGEAESVRELKSRRETQDIRSLALGADVPLGAWRLQAAAGFSQARETSPLGIAGAKFEADDSFNGVGFTDSRRPRLLGPSSLQNAALYALTEIEAEEGQTRDRERHLRLDLSRGFRVGSREAELKFGGKTSHRSKTNAMTTYVLEDLDEAPLSLSDAQRSLAAFSSGSVDYAWGDFGPAIGSDAVRALLQRVKLADFVDDEATRINTWRMDEQVQAAYVQGRVDLGSTTLLGGVRVERARLQAQGTGLDNGDFKDVKAEKQQTHWLPGLHLRHDFDNRTALRAAWSNSVVRPTFEQLMPAYVIDGDEAEFGNPHLRSLKSSNLDVGVERQLGFAGAVSAYAFHKRIQNFVYQTDVAGAGDWAAFDEAITYANGDRASVSGVELAWSRSWRELPGAWGGLVTSANGSFSRSKARIVSNDGGVPQGRDIPLPSQSDRSLNLVLGYEQPSFGLRLAANHKSKYLLEVGDPLDAGADLYVKAQTQWDLSARLALSRQVSLVFEAMNLNDSPYDVYTGQPQRNAQYETYGRSFRVAVKVALF
jgi:TonB-dependent receptor